MFNRCAHPRTPAVRRYRTSQDSVRSSRRLGKPSFGSAIWGHAMGWSDSKPKSNETRRHDRCAHGEAASRRDALLPSHVQTVDLTCRQRPLSRAPLHVEGCVLCGHDSLVDDTGEPAPCITEVSETRAPECQEPDAQQDQDPVRCGHVIHLSITIGPEDRHRMPAMDAVGPRPWRRTNQRCPRIAGITLRRSVRYRRLLASYSNSVSTS